MEKKGVILLEIGSFDLELTFKSTNEGINKLIDYINSLGHPELLLETGSTMTTEGLPEVMSNPLAKIDTLSLANTLDMNNPTEPNSGRVVIKFFVRGSSPSVLQCYLKQFGHVEKIYEKKNYYPFCKMFYGKHLFS